MGFDSFIHYLQMIFEVFIVNLLLSGDNAVAIGLACRSLPPELKRRAMLIGIEAAVVMRVLLTAGASLLMRIPLLQLIGGIALMLIAIKLTVERQGKEDAAAEEAPPATDLWSAVGTIFLADLIMSVDNVVALAAVAQGSVLILAIGVLMSVPFLLYGSLIVSALLHRYPLLKRGGGAMLGWLAGDIAISDPMISGWVSQQSPALSIVVPLLVVVYVLYQSRIMERNLAAGQALLPRPRRSPRAAAARAAPVPVISAAAPPPPAAAMAPAEALHEGPARSAVDGPATPRPKRRIAPWMWIVAGALVLLLWAFFHFMSLGYDTQTPAVQWSTPASTM